MRRDRSHLFPLISTLLFFSTLSYGQAWSGVLAPSRAIDWSQAGLPATFPDGETTPDPWTPPTRTQCGATVNPTGTSADATNINNAIAACSAGHYVLLGSGTFNVTADIKLSGHNNVTLRGSGGSTTILHMTSGASVSVGSWSDSQNAQTGWSRLTNLASNYTRGQTTITVSGGSAPHTGVAWLSQCNTGLSASSGAFVYYQDWAQGNNGNVKCNIGTQTDSASLHSLFVCWHGGATCATNGGSDPNPASQQQTVYVDSVTGTGPWTVHFTPGLYMQNWDFARTATLAWTSQSNIAVGMGLEDLTVDIAVGSGGSLLAMHGTYASWVKGVRVIQPNDMAGGNPSKAADVRANSRSLFSNSYIQGIYLPTITYVFSHGGQNYGGGNTDVLFLNNIVGGGIWEGAGSGQGNIFGYNYMNNNETDMLLTDYDHEGGTAFMLREGNEFANSFDDNTWGSHALDTWFRNYVYGYSYPYHPVNSNGAIEIGGIARFENVIGNAIGGAFTTSFVGGSNDIIPTNGVNDSISFPSLMYWGNYAKCPSDPTGGNHCNTSTWNSSDVPTSIANTDGTFNNPVPSNRNLPPSFFMDNVTASPSGGTGLSWWKVCTDWPNCSTFDTPPFPPIGPDVSTVPTVVPDIAGHAADIPAALAWKNLPIDASYQVSHAVGSSSWSNGIETLSGLTPAFASSTHLIGGFQLTGVNNACFPAGAPPSNSELLMTSSSTTSISYALAANPGTNACNGTVRWPDVRLFDERVYQSDPAGSGGVMPPTGLTAVAH